MSDWSPDYEYETIKVYFNGKEYNMKDEKDRKEIERQQKIAYRRERLAKIIFGGEK